MTEGAGCLGLNRYNQIVWAGDRVKVTRGQQYRCICSAQCGCVLVLKRGERLMKSGKPMAAHFAYPSAGRRDGCSGIIPSSETIAHNHAKWLVHDRISEFTFWEVCGVNHRLGTNHSFEASEWICTVEKKIPLTNRIADVLLEHIFLEEVVAIEICNTNKVGVLKAQECRNAKVHIIEVLAESVNLGVRILDNQMICYDSDECELCFTPDTESCYDSDECNCLTPGG